MRTTNDPDRGAAPVERFKPTTGMFTGYAGLVLAAAALAYVATSVHTTTGLRVGVGAAFAAVLVWSTQLRPRAAAYPHSLLLRNSFSDVRIPLVLVEEVTVRHTLNVWASGRRFVCVGIGSSRRSLNRGHRRRREPSLLGSSRWHEFAERAERAAPDQTGMSYEQFVVTRVEELVDQAKRDTAAPGAAASGAAANGAAAASARVQRLLAWPEIAALAVTGAAFVVSLFV